MKKCLFLEEKTENFFIKNWLFFSSKKENLELHPSPKVCEKIPKKMDFVWIFCKNISHFNIHKSKFQGNPWISIPRIPYEICVKKDNFSKLIKFLFSKYFQGNFQIFSKPLSRTKMVIFIQIMKKSRFFWKGITLWFPITTLFLKS